MRGAVRRDRSRPGKLGQPIAANKRMDGEHHGQREGQRDREQKAGRRDIAHVTSDETESSSIQLKLNHVRATEGGGAAVVGFDVLDDHGARAKTETVEADVNRRFRTMMTMAARTRAGQPEGYYTPILLAREARGVTGEGMERRGVSVIP